VNADLPLYQQVADRIAQLIHDRVYEPGERLPSIRDVHADFSVSINTAREAFRVLEDRGVVEARSQSGHYVRTGPLVCDDDGMEFPVITGSAPLSRTADRLTRRVLTDSMRRGWINLATAEPPADLLPGRRLAELTARALRRDPHRAVAYELPPGPELLRAEIAKRVARGGVNAAVDDILVTAGCLEAVFVSLLTVCRAGDSVLIESPGFYLFHQLLDRLGLKAVEVPSRPGTGVDPDDVRTALDAGPIRAALLTANFSNPTGGTIPEDRKREIGRILAQHGVFLIEDDIYGEMAWDMPRPASLAAFADPARTVLCSSFSKSVSPGYRIGWVTGGADLVERAIHTKLVTSAAVSTPAAVGISEFLAGGGYDRWIRSARRHYRSTVPRLREAIAESFPAGTRSTRPAGGMVIWVVMPAGVDSVEAYERVRREGVAFAPGPVFSLHGAFANCLRINATDWSSEIDTAVRRIGAVASDLARESVATVIPGGIGSGTSG